MALLVFNGAAPHTKARESEIGWTPRQRARRLGLVVNNSRFLVLPERHKYPNLASRVLGLSLKRLNGDWQKHWGHPVVLVESYVDESQYRGTCYRACGFKALGFTAGYGRSSRDYYEEHGKPKQLYVRELRTRAVAILRQARLPADLAAHEEKIGGPCPLRAAPLGWLLEVFEQFKDKRRGHGLRHRQPFVMACAAVAMLMGGGGYEAFEEECGKLTQRQLRALGCRKDPRTGRYRAPSDTTFLRVLNGIDDAEFDLRLGQWMMAQEISILQSLAIDGKCLRGSARTDGKALQLLSAVSHRLRLTVAQQPMEEKSNEIPALEPLLRKLPQDFFPLNTTPVGPRNTGAWSVGACNGSRSVPKKPACAVAGNSWPCGANARNCAGAKWLRPRKNTHFTAPAPLLNNTAPSGCSKPLATIGEPVKTEPTTAATSAWEKMPPASAAAVAPWSWPPCAI